MEFFLDDPSTQHLTRQIVAEAKGLLSSLLPGAGPRYPWGDLLPDMIATALQRARVLAGLTPDDRGRLECAARQAARDWIPLHELERACQIVVSCFCRALWATVGPTDCGTMLGTCRWAADRLPDVLATLRAAYIEEMRRLGARRPDDDVIIGTLLDGGDARDIALAAGRALPEPCALVAVACADPAGRYGGFSFTVPPSAVLEALAGVPSALCAPSWDKAALVALFRPAATAAGDCVRLVRQTAQRLVDACDFAYGRPFVAGMAIAASGAGAAQAAQEAVEIAFTLARPDPPRRVAFSEDVTLEVLVGGHAALRRRLAARVAGVRARPALWATLREIYRADLDRGRTARRLGIHRSTLDYRLDRIEQLTGACPTSVDGILLFTAAQAAAHAPSQDGPPAADPATPA